MGITISKVGAITIINHTFYVGPSPTVLLANLAVTIVFSALSWSVAAPNPTAALVGIVWCAIVVYLLLRTALSDPGIIPKQPAPAELRASLSSSSSVALPTAPPSASGASSSPLPQPPPQPSPPSAATNADQSKAHERQERAADESDQPRGDGAPYSEQPASNNTGSDPSSSTAGGGAVVAVPSSAPAPGPTSAAATAPDDVQEIFIRVTDAYTRKTKLQPVELMWCYTCHLRRPLRSSHCRFCDCCIERHDHHCYFIGGTCIGARNYRYFFFYVNSLAWYALYTLTCMVMSTIAKVKALQSERPELNRSQALQDALVQMRFVPAFVILLSIGVVIMVGGLALYHCRLTCIDQTTHEDLRRYYFGMDSPFDRGSCGANCSAILCAPEQKPLLERYYGSSYNRAGERSFLDAATPLALLPCLDAGIGVQREAEMPPAVVVASTAAIIHGT